MENNLNNKKNNSFMNRILTILVLSFMLTFSVNAQSETEISKYLFEENGGSIIIDSSGNDNHASGNGLRWTTDSKFGSFAIDLHGDKDYFTMLHQTSLPEKLSFSLWVNAQGSGDDILINIYDTTDLLQVWIDSDGGDDNLYLRYKDSTETIITLNIDDLNFIHDTYYHIVLNFDFTTQTLNYYRDNILVNSFTNLDINRASESNLLRFGADIEPDQNEYDGFIDSLRVLDFLPSVSQINELYTIDDITLFIDDTTPENNVTESAQVQIINYSTPMSNAQIGSPNVVFDVLLNTPAICEIYIDNNLEATTEQILAFSFTKENLVVGEHNYFLYCSYIENSTKYEEISSIINFEVLEGSNAVEFYLYDQQDNLLLGENIYLSTPCFDATGEYNTPDKPHYIKRVVDGLAQFNLSYTNEYEFCIYRGNINFNSEINDFQTNINFPDVKNEIDLGKIIIGEKTFTYAFKMDNQDLYKIIEPEHWGKTWEVLFELIIGIVLGGGVMLIGVSINNDKLIMVGGLIIAIGMGVSITTFVGAVI